MHTLVVDQKKRVRLPEAKPGQVFSLESPGDGSFVLIPLKKPKCKEMFPPGRLVKSMTKKRDELQAELLRGCVLEPE